MSIKQSQINYLDIIPVRNVEEFTEENGKITLLVPKFKKAWMRKWLIPGKRSKYFRIHLDEMGSRIWNLIDGQKTVGSLCLLISEDNNEIPDQNNQLELRVTQFLTQLFKNRLVIFK